MKKLFLLIFLLSLGVSAEQPMTEEERIKSLGATNKGELSGTSRTKNGVDKVGMPPVKARERPPGMTTIRSNRTTDCRDESGVVFQVKDAGYKECMAKRKSSRPAY